MSREVGGYNDRGGRVFGGPHLASPEAPIFDYMNLIQRHYDGRRLQRPGERLGTTIPEEKRRTAPGRGSRLASFSGCCWSGNCPGCGRALISAVHKATMDGGPRADAMYCTRACKAEHPKSTSPRSA